MSALHGEISSLVNYLEHARVRMYLMTQLKCRSLSFSMLTPPQHSEGGAHHLRVLLQRFSHPQPCTSVCLQAPGRQTPGGVKGLQRRRCVSSDIVTLWTRNASALVGCVAIFSLVFCFFFSFLPLCLLREQLLKTG